MLPVQLLQERKRRGGVFKTIREQKKIDLIELSRRTGISRPTLRNIESGHSSWNVDTEIILMETLGIKTIEGSIELNQEGDKVTSLKITGVNLVNMLSPGK